MHQGEKRLVSRQDGSRITLTPFSCCVVNAVHGDSFDTASLRFGPPNEVNRGKGAKAIDSSSEGGNLLVTFDSMGGEFSPKDPVAKLLGKSKEGDLVLGHVRAPIHPGPTAILSSQPPRLTEPGKISVMVENFGIKASAPTTLKVTLSGESVQPITVTAPVKEIAPYAGTEVTLNLDPKLASGTSFQVETTVGEPGAASVLNSKL